MGCPLGGRVDSTCFIPSQGTKSRVGLADAAGGLCPGLWGLCWASRAQAQVQVRAATHPWWWPRGLGGHVNLQASPPRGLPGALTCYLGLPKHRPPTPAAHGTSRGAGAEQVGTLGAARQCFPKRVPGNTGPVRPSRKGCLGSDQSEKPRPPPLGGHSKGPRGDVASSCDPHAALVPWASGLP